MNTQPVDPFPNPELAPTDAAGTNTNGARFGCSRVDTSGNRKEHHGLDLKAAVGTSLASIYSGVVQEIRDSVSNDRYTEGLGNWVIVRSTVSGRDLAFMYCHLETIAVRRGAQVSAGARLGTTGRSGNAFDAPHKHLHLAVSTDRFATDRNLIDPEPFLKTSYGPNPNPPKCP